VYTLSNNSIIVWQSIDYRVSGVFCGTLKQYIYKDHLVTKPGWPDYRGADHGQTKI